MKWPSGVTRKEGCVHCPKCNRVCEWDSEEVPEYYCRYCRRKYDVPPEPPKAVIRFTAEALRSWKEKAEEFAFSEIGRPAPASLGDSLIQDKWCTLNYVEESGIAERLRQEGYSLRWARAENVPTYTDLKGWEIVVWEQPDKTPVRFKVRDPIFEYMILLKKREA